jgi:hypothetical protein
LEAVEAVEAVEAMTVIRALPDRSVSGILGRKYPYAAPWILFLLEELPTPINKWA